MSEEQKQRRHGAHEHRKPNAATSPKWQQKRRPTKLPVVKPLRKVAAPQPRQKRAGLFDNQAEPKRTAPDVAAKNQVTQALNHQSSVPRQMFDGTSPCYHVHRQGGGHRLRVDWTECTDIPGRRLLRVYPGCTILPLLLQAQSSASTPAKLDADPAAVPDTPDSQPLPCPSVPDTPASDSRARPEETAEARPQLRFNAWMGTLEGHPRSRAGLLPHPGCCPLSTAAYVTVGCTCRETSRRQERALHSSKLKIEWPHRMSASRHGGRGWQLAASGPSQPGQTADADQRADCCRLCA